MTKTLFALVLAGTLAGCSYFSSRRTTTRVRRAPRIRPRRTSTPAAQQADAVIKRDANIDSDIAAARSDHVDPNDNVTIAGADDYQRDKAAPAISSTTACASAATSCPEKNALF